MNVISTLCYEKKIREINPLVIPFVKPLLSRNFRQKCFVKTDKNSFDFSEKFVTFCSADALRAELRVGFQFHVKNLQNYCRRSCLLTFEFARKSLAMQVKWVLFVAFVSIFNLTNIQWFSSTVSIFNFISSMLESKNNCLSAYLFNPSLDELNLTSLPTSLKKLFFLLDCLNRDTIFNCHNSIGVIGVVITKSLHFSMYYKIFHRISRIRKNKTGTESQS